MRDLVDHAATLLLAPAISVMRLTRLSAASGRASPARAASMPLTPVPISEQALDDALQFRRGGPAEHHRRTLRF